DVGPGVAPGEGQLTPPREVVAQTPADRLLCRIVVVGRPLLTPAVEATGRHAEVEPLDRALHAHDLPEGVPAAALEAGYPLRRSLPLLRDDVDDPADGVGAVEPALRPAHDLDTVDRVERQLREVEATARRVLHARSEE